MAENRAMERYRIRFVFFNMLMSLVFAILANNVVGGTLSRSMYENIRSEINVVVERKFEELLKKYSYSKLNQDVIHLKEGLKDLLDREHGPGDGHTNIPTSTTFPMSSITDALSVQKVMLHNAMERILYLEGKININYEQEMAKSRKQQLDMIRYAKLLESLQTSWCHCNAMGTCSITPNASPTTTPSESFIFPIPLKNANRHLLYMVNLENSLPTLLPQNDEVEAIAYDGFAKRLYWSSKKNSNIRSTFIYGCDPKVVVADVVALGIAIDSDKELVFFFNNTAVSYADKNSNVLNICTNLNWMNKIALDTKKRRIYLLIGYRNTNIVMFGYDGCRQKKVIEERYIGGLDVDIATGILYYSCKSKLFKRDVDRNEVTLISKGDTRSTNDGISSLVVHGDTIYVLYNNYVNVFTTKGVKIKFIRNKPLEFGPKMMCIIY